MIAAQAMALAQLVAAWAGPAVLPVIGATITGALLGTAAAEAGRMARRRMGAGR